MLFILTFTVLITGASISTRADDVDFCESDLARVDPMAADPYERLGVHEGIQSTQLTNRFRAAVAHYRENPAELTRLASAYAQVRLDYASGAQFDDSPLSVAALRRAHGRIYGDPLGGRFTLGYSLNKVGCPEMDYSLMMRDVLGTPAAQEKLLALPVEVRPAFESQLNYFRNQIRRVGVEGGFEDVITLSNSWMRSQEYPRPALKTAMKTFIEFFGPVYRRAQAVLGGDCEVEAREYAKGLKWPKPIKHGSLEKQLANEFDPRTFLRKVIAALRQKESLSKSRLEEFADTYAARFLVEPAQFLQHLLYYGTDQWTGYAWDFTKESDRRAAKKIMRGLRKIWIERPGERGQPERWFDYVSVLYDANRSITKLTFDIPQRHSPLWSEAEFIFAAEPELEKEIERERAPRTIPSDILPW